MASDDWGRDPTPRERSASESTTVRPCTNAAAPVSGTCLGHGARHWVHPVAPGGTRQKRDCLGIRFPSIEVRSTESRFLPQGHAGRVGDGLKRAAVRQFDAVRHGACPHARPKHHSCAHCVRAAESRHTGQRPASRENSTDEQRKRWARPRRNRLAREEHELSKGNNERQQPQDPTKAWSGQGHACKLG